jgi:hypothetical protein
VGSKEGSSSAAMFSILRFPFLRSLRHGSLGRNAKCCTMHQTHQVWRIKTVTHLIVRPPNPQPTSAKRTIGCSALPVQAESPAVPCFFTKSGKYSDLFCQAMGLLKHLIQRVRIDRRILVTPDTNAASKPQTLQP